MYRKVISKEERTKSDSGKIVEVSETLYRISLAYERTQITPLQPTGLILLTWVRKRLLPAYEN